MENEEKKTKKPVYLKQFLVSESPRADGSPRKGAFILHTCAVNARKEFESRTGIPAMFCCQTAESETLTKENLRNFWEDGQNWEIWIEPPGMSEVAKKYFRTKELAEKMTAAKKRIGFKDWNSATDEQRRVLDEVYRRANTPG